MRLGGHVTKTCENDLDQVMDNCLQLHTEYHGNFSEQDRKLFKHVLNNIERDLDGRLVSPVLWKADIESKLATNEYLARRILGSTLSKLKKNPETLKSYDDVIKQQLADGIIEPVNDLSEMRKAGEKFSFVPHNAVVRASAQTTKVRVVFMSNLADRRFGGLSHNDISFSGANLNYALLDNLTLLRFDRYLVSYDLVKAFLQIRLKHEDANKLMFMWVKDAYKENSEVVIYRFLRLAFGMRFSPTILLTVLYYILMYKTDDDSDEIKKLKRSLYMLSYMDNIAFSTNDEESVWFGYESSFKIFEQYRFPLQKFVTNASFLQEKIDRQFNIETPIENPFFGMIWNRQTDSFANKKINLNSDACTMRQVLQTLNSQFDITGMYVPLLLRAKLFLHSLQLDKSLTWDTNIGEERRAQWNLICAQVNRHELVSVNRCFGRRNGRFRLCVFTDASKQAIGIVIYIQDLETRTLSFLLAKSRIVGKELRNKSIPVLELIALCWGIEVVQQQYRLLTSALEPINVEQTLAFTDSSIALSWLKSRVVDHGKIEKKSVIVNNKINKILCECETSPVVVNHISGCRNPSDYTSRPTSSTILSRSNFYSGPDLALLENGIGSFVVGSSESCQVAACTSVANLGSLFPSCSSFDLNLTSSFRRSARIITVIRRGIVNWKLKVAIRNPQRFDYWKQKIVIDPKTSKLMLIYGSQKRAFPEIFCFFEGKTTKCPPMITQLNLVQDSDGILRVKSKLENIESEKFIPSPILLPKSCCITKSIILDLHKTYQHGQVYKLLAALREEFYVPTAYSVVKRIISRCFTCKRLHGHTIKTNTNSYRDFRINPGKRPFNTVMMDFITNFAVKIDDRGDTQNYHILVFTCMYTRAVNLIVCPSLDTNAFLYALQLHIYSYGMMSRLISDNQTSFSSGVDHVMTLLQDSEVESFLAENNIEKLSYLPYPSGASFLGSCVESMVAQIKHVLYSSIGKRLLTLRELELCVAEAMHLVNKRPIALKEMLSSSDITNEMPYALTPEVLIKGYQVPSLNILPLSSNDDLHDPDWTSSGTSKLYDSFRQLSAVRNKIADIYSDCFSLDLEKKATNIPNRFKKQSLVDLKVNDVVKIKTRLLKPFNYPMGIVTSIERNSLDEINAVSVRKSNGEVLRRHPSDIIILLSAPDVEQTIANDNTLDQAKDNTPSVRKNPQRKAKLICQRKNTELVKKHKV